MTMEEYVHAKTSLALAESLDYTARPAETLEELSVNLDDADALHRAVTLWREQGVVVFPALVPVDKVEQLRRKVSEAMEAKATVDRTSNIRNPSFRSLRALGVEQSSEALDVIAAKLGEFLDEALQDRRQLVLEHAAYRIRPGAAQQEFHRDDSVIDSRMMSIQVSLVDTLAEQGAFEVQPATHHGDALLAPEALRVSLSIAVPEGSVMVYSPNVLHRGRGNEHHLERTIMTMTLMGQHGLVPNGIPLASLPEDEASWYLARGLLNPNSSRRAHVECMGEDSDANKVGIE
mmetsp:Transcript_98697/g.159080  ORF Transcript_98697/g.159080 Transcript_98697/m.159080 type:complete len:290 (-) Transcript_98697:701-1570(-)